ncbi:hypothetical protein SDC9_113134 [bioreactor metagenome]|uniref:Uncharacterized protein n=1 Tax=bioreactor metagenome TaxID=1076179 RepID=A0A645BLW9_9ZZZZ
MEEIGVGRADETDVVRRDAAHDAGREGRHDEDRSLVAGDVDADHLRRHFGAVQRAQGPTEGRVDQVLRSPDGDHQQHGDHPVPLAVVADLDAEQRHRRHRHAVRAAGPLRLVAQRDVDDDAQPERRHRQVMPLQLEDRPRHQRRQQCRGDGAGEQGE